MALTVFAEKMGFFHKGSAGFGVKHWWKERITGAKRRRLGWRIDGRLQIRQTGLALGEDKIRFAPLVFGGIVFGF